MLKAQIHAAVRGASEVLGRLQRRPKRESACYIDLHVDFVRKVPWQGVLYAQRKTEAVVAATIRPGAVKFFLGPKEGEACPLLRPGKPFAVDTVVNSHHPSDAWTLAQIAHPHAVLLKRKGPIEVFDVGLTAPKEGSSI